MPKIILKLGGILFAITFCVALLLAGANHLTEARIAENDRLAAETARKEALPEGETFTELAPDLYEAKTGDTVVGWCVTQKPVGFGGEITLTVGISTDGTVEGVQILSHSETPGLGARSTTEWKDQFIGKHEGVGVNKVTPSENEVLAITGATITSRAVTQGVNDAFATLRSEGLLKGGE